MKEYEGLIESLKVENKSSKSNAKECEKKLLSVQKESKTLIQHILLAKDVISGKSKYSVYLIYLVLLYPQSN